MLFAGLALLSGCATPPPAAPTPPVAPRPAAGPLEELEPLYQARATRDALVIRVASNGCTKKEDFAVYAERRGGAVTLAFGRKRLDPCRAFAMGHADLVFPYAELGVTGTTPVFVLNPFAAWTGPGE
jgi:hypothetical protein